MSKPKQEEVWCPFPDCFSCPYRDCIKDRIFSPIREKTPRLAVQKDDAEGENKQAEPPSKYSLLPEAEKKRRRELATQWQKDNRERVRAKKRQYYQKNREKINAQRRKRYMQQIRREVSQAHGQKHLSDGQTGQRIDAGAGC